jgi:hypothetical protein
MNRTSRMLWGFVVGVAVTPITAYLALLSTGGGHGDYIVVHALYPFTLLILPYVAGSLFAPIVVAIGLLQFPVYGTVVAAAPTRRWQVCRAVIVCVIHLVAVYLCAVV